MSLIQFNIQKIRYGEKRFRSIFHVRRNLRVSSTVSYFNILPSVIFQVCFLSNKESFFQDMRYLGTTERHAILSYCFELKRENTSRAEKYRSEYGVVQNMEVQIVGSHL